MSAERLPPAVLAKASLSGQEYAWPVSAVAEAVDAARACGLANLGGQAQFRFPDAVCEMYWHSMDVSDRRPGESWQEYTTRSAAEVRDSFETIVRSVNFDAEIERWLFLHERASAGVPVMEHLCFVLYFTEEST